MFQNPDPAVLEVEKPDADRLMGLIKLLGASVGTLDTRARYGLWRTWSVTSRGTLPKGPAGDPSVSRLRLNTSAASMMSSENGCRRTCARGNEISTPEGRTAGVQSELLESSLFVHGLQLALLLLR